MLSLLAAIALSAADDLSQRLFDQTKDGRWLDAADVWVRERGDLTPELAAPAWHTRAVLAVALDLNHPELSGPMRPEIPFDDPDFDPFNSDPRILPELLALRPGDPLARWEVALKVRASIRRSSFQRCACLAAVLGGAAGRLVAQGCRAPIQPSTPGDRRALTLLAAIREQRKEPLPFPTGATPFEKRALERPNASAKTLDPR